MVDDLENKKVVLVLVATQARKGDKKSAYTNTAIINFTESTQRSAIKAMTWRIIAGSVTLVTSLQFSGSMKTAMSIVGSDFFSKAMTMFIGERLI